MADIETSGFKRVQAKLDQLDDNLNDGMEKHIDDEVDKLVRAISSEIKRQGLVDDPTDKPEQIPLHASFKKLDSGGGRWKVVTTAPHARAIEEGADPHDIRPRKANILAFEPENPSQYEGNPSYDPDSGMVFAEFVNHPGNRPYNYLDNARGSWEADLKMRLRGMVREEIMKAGFFTGGV